MGTSPRGASCQSCRVSKVKCDRGDPCCARCARLGVPCVVDRKRSRWEGVRATSRSAAPPRIAEDPEYADLVSALAKYPPGAESACFKFQVRTLIETLVSKAIQGNDAAAISWATMLMSQHGFPLADFEATFKRWRVDGDGTGMGGEDKDGVAEFWGGGAEHFVESLHPKLREIFCGAQPCVGMLHVKNEPKRYFANAASDVDIEAVQRAETLEEAADAFRMHRSDYVHGLEAYVRAMEEVPRTTEGHGNGDGVVVSLPPRLSRIQREVRDISASTSGSSTDSFGTSVPHSVKPGYELHLMHTFVHVSEGGARVATVVQSSPLKRSGMSSSGDVDVYSDPTLVHDHSQAARLPPASTLDVDAWLDEIGGWDSLQGDEQTMLQDLLLFRSP